MTDAQDANLKSDVKDVSSIFDHYRISARAIWNTAFWPDQDFRNWDSIEQFHEIEKLLFQELVLAKVDRNWPLQDLFGKAIPFFQIVPSLVHGTKVAAGGCGGCGLTARSDLTAMGIESFFVCSLLILLGLGKSEES
jgi:hypothetical protein